MRAYPASVSLIRRSGRGRSAAPVAATLSEVESWLLGDAAGEADILALVESFLWRLVAAGFPLAREACMWARCIPS